MASLIRTAKIFRNGGSRAIRLPKEFELEGDEVVLKQDFGVITILPKGAQRIAACNAEGTRSDRTGRSRSAGLDRPARRSRAESRGEDCSPPHRPAMTRYLFDTNRLSALVHQRRGFERIAVRVDTLPVAQRLVSAITLAELET